VISNEEKFSSLELQLIRSSLATRTDEEIAEILERPVEEIRSVINDMTGEAGQRQEEILKQKEAEKQAAAIKRKMRRKKAEDHSEKLETREKKEKREKKEQKRKNDEHRAQLKKQESAMTRMYRTREIDLSKMKAIKIDSRTTVFVEPGDDIEKVKTKYHNIRKQQANGTSAIEG
jgi:hypothetical protein